MADIMYVGVNTSRSRLKILLGHDGHTVGASAYLFLCIGWSTALLVENARTNARQPKNRAYSIHRHQVDCSAECLVPLRVWMSSSAGSFRHRRTHTHHHRRCAVAASVRVPIQYSVCACIDRARPAVRCRCRKTWCRYAWACILSCCAPKHTRTSAR